MTQAPAAVQAPAQPNPDHTSARPGTRPRADLPSLAELLDFARRSAADAELIASLKPETFERSWRRLEGPGGCEAWLLAWPPGSETGWHDHGGSSGAFVTAVGGLTEYSLATELPTGGWRTLELLEGQDRTRELGPGQGRAFGPRHVHQVVNESETEYAISVHVYHPLVPVIHRYGRKGNVLTLKAVERSEDW
ncbi:cysteine dioxygenase [Wenjunlia tyrosinilytica]|nr:cysteine dioxygenase [Wenjunlia tyrosinilytica]